MSASLQAKKNIRIFFIPIRNPQFFLDSINSFKNIAVLNADVQGQ
jgi:hypothetical protein